MPATGGSTVRRHRRSLGWSAWAMGRKRKVWDRSSLARNQAPSSWPCSRALWSIWPLVQIPAEMTIRLAAVQDWNLPRRPELPGYPGHPLRWEVRSTDGESLTNAGFVRCRFPGKLQRQSAESRQGQGHMTIICQNIESVDWHFLGSLELSQLQYLKEMTTRIVDQSRDDATHGAQASTSHGSHCPARVFQIYSS